MLTGTCLCGAVRYEVSESLPHFTHCHCAECRKHHGAPFATFAEVPADALHWLTGEDALSSYAPPGARERRFCPVCGSVAPTPTGDHVLVPVGNLFGNIAVPEGLHAYVASKAPWHVIADALPQYEAAAPDWAEHAADAPPHLAGRTRGSCLCGDVSFAVHGEPARWLQCHCSRCRRARSAVHGSNTFYPLSQFEWLSGQSEVRSYRPPDAARFTVSFCIRCGGGTPAVRDNVPFVLVPAALLDEDPGFRPQGHIHVASKAAWYDIDDGLPQFAELPPS